MTSYHQLDSATDIRSLIIVSYFRLSRHFSLFFLPPFSPSRLSIYSIYPLFFIKLTSLSLRLSPSISPSYLDDKHTKTHPFFFYIFFFFKLFSPLQLSQSFLHNKHTKTHIPFFIITFIVDNTNKCLILNTSTKASCPIRPAGDMVNTTRQLRPRTALSSPEFCIIR